MLRVPTIAAVVSIGLLVAGCGVSVDRVGREQARSEIAVYLDAPAGIDNEQLDSMLSQWCESWSTHVERQETHSTDISERRVDPTTNSSGSASIESMLAYECPDVQQELLDYYEVDSLLELELHYLFLSL